MDVLDIAKIADDCGIRGAPVTLTWTRMNAFAEAIAAFSANEERAACDAVACSFKVSGLITVVDAISNGIRERSNVEFRPTHAASSREVAPGTEG